jgi:hypothetical protein
VEIKILGDIQDVETIATGSGIREIERLRRVYGPGRWRKLKGAARVRLPDGTESWAEVHWYQAHGVGRREFKMKRLMGERK